MQKETIHGFRLSPQQRRLWRLEQQAGGQAYLARCVVSIEGRLNTEALAAALRDLVSRHEILRTTFPLLPGMGLPLQVIKEGAEVSIREHDLRPLGPDDQKAEIESLVNLAGRACSSREEESLLKISLLILSERSYLLIIDATPLYADAAGLKNLVRELCRTYAARLQRETEADETIRYNLISEWLNQLLESEGAEIGREFWREHAISDFDMLKLPFERQAPTSAGFAAQSVIARMNPLTVERVNAIAEQHEITPDVFLLACWQALLSRLFGGSDVVVAIACDGRTDEELKLAIGLLEKYVPITCGLRDDLPFSSLLCEVNRAVFDAYAWQECFTWEQMSSGAGVSDQTFFPFCFAFERDFPQQKAADLCFSLDRIDTCVDRFKIRLTCVEKGGSLLTRFDYDSNLFFGDDIKRLAAKFLAIVESAIDNQGAEIGLLQVGDSAELHQLMVEFNDTRVYYGTELLLHEYFEQQVARTPDSIAVVFEQHQLSYSELNARANQLAHYLMRIGVGPEVLVGICLERSVEMVLALLGTLKAGGAYLPLDPQYSADRLAYMLEDSRASVLLTERNLCGSLLHDQLQVFCINADWHSVDPGQTDNPCGGGTLDNVAYVLYTSGSTGMPKGASIPHRAIGNHMLWMDAAIHLTACDSVLQKTPFSFDASVWEFYAPLLSGARLIMARPGGHQDTAYLLKVIAEEYVTILQLVPTLLRALLDVPSLESCKSLRRVFSGGEVLTVELMNRFFDHSSADLYNLYGPTECSIDSTISLCDRRSKGWSIPIGHPIHNVETYIVDRDQWPLPLWLSGELYIGGAGLGRGYLNRPALTAEKFIPNPFSGTPGSRMYKTGDLARYQPIGSIEFLGRIDHQVKFRGFRIELGEIETVLTHHEAIRQSVVLMREDKPNEQHLVAYIVTNNGMLPSVQQLRLFLREKLPEYMIPTAFLILESLPLLANGKLDRKALPAPAIAQAATEVVQPHSPVEEILSSIWADVLRVEAVATNLNFFELGGHSLLATQVISRVREAFNVEVPLKALFERPTVAGLAEAIEQERGAGRRAEVPPIVAVSRDRQLPLSFAQQRLWFIHQLDPDSAAYNMPIAVRLEGRLEVAALRQSLQAIAQRHEVLRTRYVAVEGNPQQVIEEEAEVEIKLYDVSELEERDREREARAIARREAERGFELERGPVWRAGLVKLRQEEHVLMMTMHHIASDGWSTGVLVREFSELYEEYSGGKQAELAELEVQYGDYAVWQREWLRGEVLDQQMSYWREQLEGAPVLEMPTDRPRPSVATHRGATLPFSLSAELTHQLRQMSRQQGVTMFMTLLAAFQVVLSKYSGQDDIVVGTDVANRNRVETEPLIGFFINQLVLRTDLSANPTFKQLLARERETTLSAYQHQDLPFEKLVEELQPERDLGRSPLFQVKLVLQNAPRGELRAAGVETSGFVAEHTVAKFDMTLFLTESKDGVRGVAEYATDMYEGTSIERLVRHLEVVIEAMVREVSEVVSGVSLLRESEKQQLVVEWNDTARESEKELCLHELFERQARTTPDAVAVFYESQQLSYDELNNRAESLASYLRSIAVGPEALVAVCMDRSLEMVIGLLGALKAGAAYVPIDPSYPSERLVYMLEDSGAEILLTQRRLMKEKPRYAGKGLCLDEEWSKDDKWSRIEPKQGAGADNLAYVIYTSGSTGQPKGAMNTHRAIVNRLLWMQEMYSLGANDRVLQKTTFSFDVSVWEFFWPLLTGAALVMARPGGHGDPQYLRDVIESERITTLHFVPSMLEIFLDQEGWRRCETVSRVISSGEALPAKLATKFYNLGASCLHNLYGPTEAAVDVTYRRCEENENGLTVPIGKPISNTQIYLVDKRGQLAPESANGELCIGGTAVGRGYWNRADLTAERFIPDSYSGVEGGRVYRTGDLARWGARGEIEYLGRIDNQVKVRGYRIELGEIEAVLSKHEAVKQCAVAIRGNQVGDKQVVGYVVLTEGASVTAGELREHLRRKLPEYMVPSAIVELSELPLTPNGKLDRKALPAPVLEQAATEVVQPHSPVEEILCSIWADVLRLEAVATNLNFFELGGHSLLATQVISRVREAFNVEVPLKALFERPTVAGLAEAIEQERGAGRRAEAPPIVAVSRDRQLPLSFAQQRLWFIHQLDPDSAAYNMPIAVRLEGRLEVAALRQSLQAIAQRHEVLRTRYVAVEGNPQQVIGEEAEVEIKLYDVSELEERDREREARAIARREAERGFELERGPIWRAGLVKLRQEEHVLMMTMHHIASDGWSTGVLVREFSELYEEYSGGKQAELAELEVQYGDYAVWQREWLRGEVLDQQMSYWREQLEGAPVLEMPTDRPRPSVASDRGAAIPFRLPASLTDRLRQMSRQQGVTMFMTLLAAFQVVLSRYSGQDDIVVGTPIANRHFFQTERLIGFFINQLVLRTDLSANPTFKQLLARVRETTLSAYQHQDLPFEKLVEELQPERDLGRSPLFQVMLALHNTASADPSFSSLRLSQFRSTHSVSKLDLTLSLVETAQGPSGIFEFATDLFDQTTISRLALQMLCLLERVGQELDRPVGELHLLSEAERHMLTVEWGEAGPAEAESWPSLREIFQAQVLQRPDSIALICDEHQISYRMLDLRSGRLAARLRLEGAAAEQVVGLSLRRGPELVTAVLAVFKSGGACLAVDPATPSRRLALMLADSKASVLLTSSDLLEGLVGLQARTLCLDQLVEYDDHLSEFDGGPAIGESLAYIVYTSGSTGNPKGVAVSQVELASHCLQAASRFQLSERDCLLHLASASFDLFFEQLLPGLISGAKLLISDPSQDCLELHQILLSHSVSLIDLPPAYWREWLQMLVDDRTIPRPKALRTVIVGGEAMPASGRLLWQRAALGATLVNAYGPTEATITALVEMIERPSELQAGWPPPIGRPLAGRTAFVDGGFGLLGGIGSRGQLCLGGKGLARGYLNEAALTAERFMPDPYGEQPGGRLYRTGDLARLLFDSRVQMLGRADQQLKLHGYRIEAGEVEAQLERVDGVEQAVVALRQGRQGEGRLVAYYVSSRALSAEQIRKELAQTLPHYMLPSAFVRLDHLPMSVAGKVDRKRLPDPEPEAGLGSYEPPRTQVERVLCQIWEKVLGVEKVGIRDNFFELGGDSILSIQLIALARKAGLRLTPKQFFQHQCIAELAQVAEQVGAGAGQQSSAEQGLLVGEFELTPIQQEFFSWELAEANHYNQAVMLELKAGTTSGLLEQAVSALLQHHDSLRLSYSRRAGNWVQCYGEVPARGHYLRRDLSRLTESQQQQAMSEDALRVQASLDVRQGQIVRLVEYDLGSGGRRLLMVIHHLAVDGVSWRILLKDLERIYGQIQKGEVAWPGEKTTSYRQWAECLSQYASTRKAIEAARYWVGSRWEQAWGGMAVDDQEADNKVRAARSLTKYVSQQQTDSLLKLVAAAYQTQINEVLVTALGLAYRRWSGEASLVLEMEGHGREDEFEGVDVTRTVGWFTSAFPVIVEVGRGGAVEALRRVRQQLRRVPARGLTYGVVKYLSPLQQQEAELEEVINEIRKQGRAQISFNYLGQVDQVLWESELFRGAEQGAGATQGGGNERGVELEVTGIVAKGRLRVDWRYAPGRHREERIRELAEYFEEGIRELIEGAEQRMRQVEQISREYAGEVEWVYELSPMQQGMLFHTLYEPGQGAYFEQVSCLMKGELEDEAFRRSWEAVVERHEILRTSIRWEVEGESLQVVHRRMAGVWQQADWRDKSRDEQERMLEEYLEEDRRKGFDLREGPLMRVVLIKVGERSNYLVWSSHHALYDGWSRRVLIEEVFSHYESYRRGEEPRLSEARQYREYIEWLKEQDESEAERFWREELKGVREASRLEVGRRAGRVEEPGERAEKVISIDEGLRRRLEEAAREAKVTMSTMVEGAWAVVLSRYGSEQEVVVGVTVSGRRGEIEGIETMLGLMINTLPVRVEVREEQEVGEYLREVQMRQARVMEYEYSPLMKVQGWGGMGAGRRMFETIVVVQNYPGVGAAIEKRAGEWLRIEEVRGREDVNYEVLVQVGMGKHMTVRVSYDNRRYEGEEIERVMGSLMEVLEGMSEGVGKRVGEMRVMSERQRQQVLVEWNDTAEETRREESRGSVAELFEEQSKERADAVAVEYAEEQVSYRELNRRANQIANYLVRQGVRSENPVAICLDRSIDMLVAMLGVLKAGGAYVPLDPKYPRDRVEFMLQDAGVEVLVTKESYASIAPESSAQRVLLDCDREAIHQQSTSNPCVKSDPDNLAYVIYTSGSTGKPKGVSIAHSNAVAFLSWAHDIFGGDCLEGILATTSICFDLSIFELFAPLCFGGRIILADNVLALSDITGGVSLINTVPSAMQGLLNSSGVPRSVRTVNLAGEALSGELVQRLYRETGVERVYNLYGPTETTTYSTFTRVTNEDGVQPTIGKPVANTQVYLVNETIEAVPMGASGELCIGGLGLARGYMNRADLTAEKFVPDPFGERAGGRMYRTGDVARHSESGEIEYVGRRDNQVKVRGYRIELGEIEAVLSKHEAVKQCAVCVREDERGSKRIVAYVVQSVEQALPEAELRSYLQGKLPSYMLPWMFIEMTGFPLTPNGKLDRKALPAPAEAKDLGEEPRTSVEKILAGIWAEVLRLKRVSIHQNFFELGGDSILSIQIVSKAQQAGIPIRPWQIFEHHTIAELAEVVGTTSRAQAQQGIVTGPVILTPIQRWFFSQECVHPHHFNQSAVLESIGRLDREKFELAIGMLLTHHDALRMRFRRESDQWQQVNSEEVGRDVIGWIDLHSLEADQRKRAFERAAEELQSGLDLERGPLFRVGCIEFGPQEPARLIIVAHHLVIDGVSWRILLEDLEQVYGQAMRGEPMQLQPKTTSYQQWAQALSDYRQNEEVLMEEADYWLATAKQQPSEFPRDHSRGENTVASRAAVLVELSEEETDQLVHELPRVHWSELQDALIAALVESLTDWCGGSRLLLELEGHGREEEIVGADLTRTVGWFTTIYPVWFERAGKESPRQQLERVRKQLEAVPSRGIGYGILRYLDSESAVSQQLARGPKAEICFNYLGQFDQVLDRSSFFRPRGEAPGANRSLQQRPQWTFEVSCWISQDRLHVDWVYSLNLHSPETVERLAQDYLAALRRLLLPSDPANQEESNPDITICGFDAPDLDSILEGVRIPSSPS